MELHLQHGADERPLPAAHSTPRLVEWALQAGSYTRQFRNNRALEVSALTELVDEIRDCVQASLPERVIGLIGSSRMKP